MQCKTPQYFGQLVSKIIQPQDKDPWWENPWAWSSLYYLLKCNLPCLCKIWLSALSEIKFQKRYFHNNKSLHCVKQNELRGEQGAVSRWSQLDSRIDLITLSDRGKIVAKRAKWICCCNVLQFNQLIQTGCLSQSIRGRKRRNLCGIPTWKHLSKVWTIALCEFSWLAVWREEDIFINTFF